MQTAIVVVDAAIAAQRMGGRWLPHMNDCHGNPRPFERGWRLRFVKRKFKFS